MTSRRKSLAAASLRAALWQASLIACVLATGEPRSARTLGAASRGCRDARQRPAPRDIYQTLLYAALKLVLAAFLVIG